MSGAVPWVWSSVPTVGTVSTSLTTSQLALGRKPETGVASPLQARP